MLSYQHDSLECERLTENKAFDFAILPVDLVMFTSFVVVVCAGKDGA